MGLTARTDGLPIFIRGDPPISAPTRSLGIVLVLALGASPEQAVGFTVAKK